MGCQMTPKMNLNEHHLEAAVVLERSRHLVSENEVLRDQRCKQLELVQLSEFNHRNRTECGLDASERTPHP